MNPFSLLCSIFFLSRKLCFLWSPCLLLLAESISLDTSGKPTVGFFLKMASSSWIIFSISLDEFNSSDWLLRSWSWIFSRSWSWILNKTYLFLFYCHKRIFIGQKKIRGFLEKLTDYFLNIVVNINFFGYSKFEYYWALTWNPATSKP